MQNIEKFLAEIWVLNFENIPCSSFFRCPIFQLKIWIGGDKEMGWWSLEEGSCLQILREVELPHADLVRGISSFWKEWLWVRRQAKLRALACHLLIMEPARLSNRKLFASPRPHISKLLLLCWGTEGIAGVWLLAGSWLLSSNQKNVYDQLEWSLVSHPPVCDTFFDLIKLWGKGRGRGNGHWGGNVTRWNMQSGLQPGGGQKHFLGWCNANVVRCKGGHSTLRCAHPSSWHFRVPEIFHHFLQHLSHSFIQAMISSSCFSRSCCVVVVKKGLIIFRASKTFHSRCIIVMIITLPNKFIANSA